MIQLRGHWSRTLSGTSLVVALLLLLAGERASALTADDSAALTTTPDLAKWFLLAACVPVALRAGVLEMGKKLFEVFSKCACMRDKPITGTADGKFGGTRKKLAGLSTFDLNELLIQNRALPWLEACEKAGLSTESAWRLAAARLALWHLLQPVTYLVAFSMYSDASTSTLLQTLSCLVAVREALYAACCVLGCWTNPAYLLVDVWCTLSFPGKRNFELLLESLSHVLDPYTLFGMGSAVPLIKLDGCIDTCLRLLFFCVFGLPMNLVASAAFYLALTSVSAVPPALMLNYASTFLYILVLLGYPLYDSCCRTCSLPHLLLDCAGEVMARDRALSDVHHPEHGKYARMGNPGQFYNPLTLHA